MKTIVVLTDFSKNARLAAEAALTLAPEIGANILLFHAYMRSQYVPSLSNTGWPAECFSSFQADSKKALKEEVKHLENIRIERNLSPNVIDITYLNSEGTLIENVPMLLKKYDTSFILMGGRTKKSGDLIFGNDIQDVVNKANCPVLIVPEETTSLEYKNIAFATDLSKGDIAPLKWLMKFADGFKAKINICHVSKPVADITDFSNEDLIYSFVNETVKMHKENISFTDIMGTHIVEELEKFRMEKHQDLLVLVYKKHSIFWRMFHESPARNFIQQQKGPILILPEDRIDNEVIASAKVKFVNQKKQRLYLL